MTELHSLLRERTAPAHRALDSRLAEGGLLDTRQGYRAFLEGWYRLQHAVERRLEASGVEGVLEDWLQRRRASLLAADLAALGAPLPRLRRMGTFGSPQSVAGVLGTAYVVEGATLGAAVLLPRFSRLGIADAYSTAFLAASVEAGTTGWPALLAILRARSADVDADAVVDAAMETFAWANACFFNRPSVPRAPRRSCREPQSAIAD